MKTSFISLISLVLIVSIQKKLDAQGNVGIGTIAPLGTLKFLAMKTLLFFCIGLLLCSCCDDNKTEGIIPESLISPGNADLLTLHLIMPEGTQRIQGKVPSTSIDFASNVTIENPNVLSSNGATTSFHVFYNYAHNHLKGFYAQVEGSTSYFKIPFQGISGSHGERSLPICIPGNVDQGEFSISLWVFDKEGRVSNAAKTWFTILRLGTGAVQINLTWDTTADLDLHVYDPMGGEIYYGIPSSHSEGILDRFDNDGFGPENIYWDDTAPDGIYSVEVEDKTGNGETSNFMVTVGGDPVCRNFTGSTINGNKVTVVTFTKDGDSILF